MKPSAPPRLRAKTSNAQRIMLFSLFNRACQAANLTGTIARDQYREQLTIEALGSLVSWSDLTNAQVDKIKAELLAVVKPADLDAQLAQLNQPRIRALHAINQTTLARGGAYVAKIARDKFQTGDPDLLTTGQLQHLAMTLNERSRSERQRLRPHPVNPESNPAVAGTVQNSSSPLCAKLQPEIPY